MVKRKIAWYKQGSELKQEIEQASPPNHAFVVWFIGQAGIVLKWKNQVIYIDPILNDLTLADGSSRRNYPPPFTPKEAAKPDIILCTHAHMDHLNLNTLTPMLHEFPNAKVVVPAPEVKHLLESGIAPNQIVKATQECEILFEDIRICPIAAAHPTYRTDENGSQYALCYLIRLGDQNIFHSGDTLLTKELLERLQKEKIDLAGLSMNGWDFEREQCGIVGNMSYRDAGYLAGMIEADMTIPLHYDMIIGNEADPFDLLKYMWDNWSNRKCHVMKLGERLVISNI